MSVSYVISLSARLLIVFSLTACGGGGGGGGSDAPSSSAINDTASLNEDSTITINVTNNDTNVTAVTASITTDPLNGIASINNGSITYSPDADFSGTDTIRYTVDSNINSDSHTATLTLTVTNINDAPLAVGNFAISAINAPLEINIRDNDLDVDDNLQTLTVELITDTTNGATTLFADGLVAYQPDPGYIGPDGISYRLTDPSGAVSNIASLIINVVDLSQTTLVTQEIPIPTKNYGPATDENATIFQVSEHIAVNVHASAVSVVMSLIGPSVTNDTSLFIVDIQTPQGIVLARRDAIFCDLGLCTVDIPKTPDISIEPGLWNIRLGALDIELVNLNSYQLRMVSRIGPTPLDGTRPNLRIKPFITGSVLASEANEIMMVLEQLADLSNIDLTIDPVTIITDISFTEVSADFRDPTTTALITQGEADKVNIFLIESFSGIGGGGVLGISSGLPGSLGLVTEYNGVLINGTATLSADLAFYRRTTAEFVFHEMGHLLGLFHTTETNFSAHDILNDTPECREAVHDSNNNGTANSNECPDGLNPMFWVNNLSSIKGNLSLDQQRVLRAVVLSQP